jgi:hypothetical protein
MAFFVPVCFQYLGKVGENGNPSSLDKQQAQSFGPSKNEKGMRLLRHHIKTGRGVQEQYRGNAGSFKLCGHGTLSGEFGY